MYDTSLDFGVASDDPLLTYMSSCYFLMIASSVQTVIVLEGTRPGARKLFMAMKLLLPEFDLDAGVIIPLSSFRHDAGI